MLNNKQIRMLELLDGQIQQCEKCNLFNNGRVKPYWTNQSKYIMILESQMLTGKTAKIFWELASEYQLVERDFVILSSVNCKMINGKPSEYHRDCCRDWIHKYIKVVRPDKIVLMGNYACHTILNEWGITKLNGLLTSENVCGIDVNVIRSFHPFAMVYNKDKSNIRKVLKQIRE